MVVTSRVLSYRILNVFTDGDIAFSGNPLCVFEDATGLSEQDMQNLARQLNLSETVRYSGSPIALSFSEAAHRKGSVLVDVSPGALSTEFMPAPATTPLAILRGDLLDLLHDRRHQGAESAYCQITLTDAVRPMGAMERVRRRFPHTLVLAFEPVGAQVVPAMNAALMHQRSDLDPVSYTHL